MTRSPHDEDEGSGGFSETDYVATVNRHARVAKGQRGAAIVAEPLLAGLEAGVHHFAPEQFIALARYLFNGEHAKIEKAFKRKRFSIGPLEFVWNATLLVGPLTSIAEFSRERGVDKETLRRLTLSEIALRKITQGQRKLYYVSDLEALLPKVRGYTIRGRGQRDSASTAAPEFRAVSTLPEPRAANGQVDR